LAGIFLLFCTHMFCQQYSPGGKRVFDKVSMNKFAVQTVSGRTTHLPVSSKELLVIAFLSPECPLCKNYSGKLEKLAATYDIKGSFVGIIPGTFEIKDIIYFQKNYLPSWKIFRDTSLLLTHYLDGKVTPEVLVIDNKNGSLLYKGAIDDWVVSLGKTKNHVSNYYLQTALHNFLNNKPSIPFTSAVGCLINDF